MEEKVSKADEATLAVMANNIEYIQKDIVTIKEDLKGKFVTKEKHDALADRVKLIQSIVFGMIALIVVAFLTAVINFFIQGR